MNAPQSLLGRSLLERLANRRAERDLARRVEQSFEPDAEALTRVRSAILAQVPGGASVERRQVAARSRPQTQWRAAPALAVIAIALAGGLAVVALRPWSSAAPPAGVGSGPSASTSAAALADLDRSDSALQSIVTAARTGDAAALTAMLVAYQANLASIEADVHLPGTDLGVTADRLRSQAAALAGIAGSVTATNAVLFGQVRNELDGIVASLPAPATPPPSNPGKGRPSPSPSPAPAGTHQPGSSNAGGNGNSNAGGNGNGNGNAGGNGNGNAGGNGNGNGNGNAGGNGNGNAGGNGNGKGHNKGASPSP